MKTIRRSGFCIKAQFGLVARAFEKKLDELVFGFLRNSANFNDIEYLVAASFYA